MGSDLATTPEETTETLSKAARFQNTFPEITIRQGEIIGPFSLYFGVKLSELEAVKIPALETRITEETDKNTLFFLQIEKEAIYLCSQVYRQRSTI